MNKIWSYKVLYLTWNLHLLVHHRPQPRRSQWPRTVLKSPTTLCRLVCLFSELPPFASKSPHTLRQYVKISLVQYLHHPVKTPGGPMTELQLIHSDQWDGAKIRSHLFRTEMVLRKWIQVQSITWHLPSGVFSCMDCHTAWLWKSN